MRAILWVMLFLGAAGGIYALGSHLADRERPLHPDDPRLLTGDAKIVMLAADWCGYCRKLQAEFEREGVRYRVLDVDEEEGDRAASALGTRGVPVTVIGQEVIHGYDTAAIKSRLEPLGYDVF
jgi:glutaredoxin